MIARTGVTLGLCLALPLSAAAAITNVDHADDVCSPAANPCTITQTIETVDGAILDFGLREVRITGGGEIDAGTGDVTLLCGKLFIQKSGNAIRLKGTSAFGDTRGGTGRFIARKSCSGNTSLPCRRDSECAAASAGTCSVGSGEVLLDGKVLGTAAFPGTLIVAGAGDVDVASTVTINGDTLDSDGGTMEITSRGDMTITARLQVSSGGLSTGGEVCLSAAGDLTVTDLIDATGGDFDGGFVELFAGGTLTVTDDIKANATVGEGFGGEVSLQSDGDMIIDGGGPSNRLLITTDGHMSSENFGGDGGTQDYFSGGAVHFGPFVRMTSDGAAPDGFGESITVDAGLDMLIEGEIQSKGTGGDSGGGEIDLSASGVLEIAPGAILDVTGTEGGGGDVDLAGDEGLVMAGSVVANGSLQGSAGSIDIDSGQDLTISGSIETNGEGGGAAGLLTMGGCNINVTASAFIDNKPDGSINRFVSREQFTSGSGSDVRTGSGGSNVIIYRSSAKPPILAGSFSPSPQLQLTPQLVGCPICGNGDVETGETCDDGGTTGGDGCSAECQDEGCVADTPGYPGVPLCDDGDNCTVDACNTQTSSCDHSASCDDGIDCTLDECVGATCTHTPDDGACASTNPCATSICNAGSGCVVDTPMSGPCDDGVFCNGADTCDQGQCSIHAGSPCDGLPECQDGCNESSQVCGSPFGTPCTSDGNLCTDNVCDGGGSCIAINNSSPCNDGIFCNGSDVCVEGSCSFHAGTPCLLGSECRAVCDEAAADCRTPEFEPCTDDENQCTDDYCDGLGSCVHPDNTATCQGEGLCESNGTCSAGQCLVSAAQGFAAARLLIVAKPALDDDQFVLKADFTAATLQGAPGDDGIQLELRNADGTASFVSLMPAAAIVVKGSASKPTFKFKDAKGLIPEANGVRTANVKHIQSRSSVRTKFRMKGVEVGDLLNSPDVAVSLLLGDDPATGDCVSGTPLACERKGTKLRCEN